MSARALDRLAAAAVAIALVPLPLLGIAHPMSQLLVTVVAGIFAWLCIRSRPPGIGAAEAVNLAWSGFGVAWLVVAGIGASTAVARWLLDTRVFAGRGGLTFYHAVLRQYGVLDAAGRTHWAALVPLLAVVYLLILVDGLFYVGLVQRRLALRVGRHAAVWLQGALFGLVHTFSGASADVAYGIGAGVGGIVYGYVFERVNNHSIPSAMLWMHVGGVFVIMLATSG